MNLFKLITLDGIEENLPKESGRYDVKLKDSGTERWQYFTDYEESRRTWLKEVHSYYAPVEIDDVNAYVVTEENSYEVLPEEIYNEHFGWVKLANLKTLPPTP